MFRPVAITGFSHLYETLDWVGRREENLRNKTNGHRKKKGQTRKQTLNYEEETDVYQRGDG